MNLSSEMLVYVVAFGGKMLVLMLWTVVDLFLCSRASKADKQVKKRGGGFQKVCSLSPQLQKVMGESELARTEVRILVSFRLVYFLPLIVVLHNGIVGVLGSFI